MNDGIVSPTPLDAETSDAVPYGLWGASRQRSGIDNLVADHGTVDFLVPYVVDVFPEYTDLQYGDTPWSSIAEALPCDMDAMQFMVSNTASNTRSHMILMDVAVGPAGKEVEVLHSIYVGGRQSGEANQMEFLGPFPLTLKAGSRVAVRFICDSWVATPAAIGGPYLTTVFHKKWPNAGTRAATIPHRHNYETYGWGRTENNTTNSTKNPYQAIGTCPFDAKWCIPGIMWWEPQINSTTLLYDFSYLDNSGADVVFLQNIPFHHNANEEQTPVSQIAWPCNIPAGATIRVRYQQGSATVWYFSMAQLVVIGD